MAVVRITKTKNVDLVRDLDRQVFGDSAPPPRATHVWWIVRVDGELAGYCGLGVYESEGGYAFLSRAGVLPAFRGRGLQRKMIRVRVREARRLGVSPLITYVARFNETSANNLIREGFTLYTPMYKWGVEGALYFWKDVKPLRRK